MVHKKLFISLRLRIHILISMRVVIIRGSLLLHGLILI